LISGLRVHTERMRKNIDLTRGLIFSGQLLLDLAAAGLSREEAYRLVQAHAMKAWESDGDFRQAIEADPLINNRLTKHQLHHAFSFERQLENVHRIFARTFNS